MTTKLLSMLVAVASFLPIASRADTPPQDCYGVSDSARALHSDAIESVSPIYRSTRSGRHLYGAAITYRPGLGVTAPQMQETLDHQIAGGRHHAFPESPFTLNNVDAIAHAKGDRLLVEITSDDARSADQILKRVRRFPAVPQR